MLASPQLAYNATVYAYFCWGIQISYCLMVSPASRRKKSPEGEVDRL